MIIPLNRGIIFNHSIRCYKDDEVKRELAKGNTLINYIEISTTIREQINKINYIFYSIW